MKDQRRLLTFCMEKDIPAVVFQGTDACAVEILKAALEIYRKNGCSEEFLYDWQLLINDVAAFQEESPDLVKIPRISPVDTLILREEIEKRETR